MSRSHFGLVLALLWLAWFAGCAPKSPHLLETSTQIAPFLKQVSGPLPKTQEKRLYADFLARYYRPWQLDELDTTAETASWAVRHYAGKALFAENRRPLPKARFDAWVENADYEAFNTLKRHAIVVHPTSLRLFPTRRPIFYDPSLPGEGYPFDYNQNSAIKACTPLIVSHLSRDGGWAFVQSPFALGWLPVRDIAFVSEKQIETIMRLPKLAVLKEYIPVYDGRQNFLFYAKMATLFPWAGEEEGFYKILVPQKEGGSLSLSRSLLPKAWASAMPLEMKRENVGRVASQLLGEPYGWGGMAEDRDCSAMTRDFFAPFGIWLPRNSKAQAKAGKAIDLQTLSAKEKERIILKEAVPFRTLLYLPGHIMLYVGKQEGRAYAMHNIWGIRTGNGGRYIVGKAVITDLWLGENLPEADKASLLIERIRSMNIVVEF
ncbi:SH3 domain-containing C40 family peptidase [Hydrogenimonas cancrithermarum]|uniref:Hydrolase Nlp/P60 n=1 Tax=Hydrogenimonas cancrithermarum TaxID=2993563 RepID=A0ABM8FM38_9BACT|nr:SH3 domain-containing C40 family peptidase [Hydrogenimonas cancrithermarum]BDY13395.1 hydrolase Nlp/P60 [Hydrogenimonas cancrithermarum]